MGQCHMPRTKVTQLYVPTASFATSEECKEIKVTQLYVPTISFTTLEECKEIKV